MPFRPKWLPTLATLLVLPVLLYLGYWQLDRAEQKRQLQNTFAENRELAAAGLEELDAAAASNRFRRVRAAGRYDSERQILLDNQVRERQAGYHVYTPFKLTHSERMILVNRGWVPLPASRQQLPELAVAEQQREIVGRLGQPANPGLLLANETTPDWPYIVQHIDYAQLESLLQYPLLPVVLLLDPQSEDGYVRQWQPRFGGFGPERHIAYAVQWFALAATLLIIYLLMTLKWRASS